MGKETKIRIVVDEDRAVVERIDALAQSEGIARADVLRRAIRKLLFSMPRNSTFGETPETSSTTITPSN